jgi:U6 snRNA-associated Sm-like protein LSm6
MANGPFIFLTLSYIPLCVALSAVCLQGSEAAALTKKRSPSDFLKSVLGRPARVKLNSGIEYRGVLACLDGYMNLVMEQTEEYVDGQLKAKYGDTFIRGNNGTSPRGIYYEWSLPQVINPRSFLQCFTFQLKRDDERLLELGRGYVAKVRKQRNNNDNLL